MVLIRELGNIESLLNVQENPAHNMGGKAHKQKTAAYVFRLDLKDCCTCVPPRSEILLLHLTDEFRLTVVKLKNECT